MASRIVSIVGRKDAGKTTLAVALISEFVRRGKRVMSLKHGHHPAAADHPGTDTWRHFNEGPAERTLIASPELRVLFERTPDDYDPVALARQYLSGADIVIAEGFSRAPLPKVEVFRPSVSPTPLHDPSDPRSREWLAIVTDDQAFRADCPVLRFGDTAWLSTLSRLVWSGALEITE